MARRVAVIGSGNWGSTVAKIVGANIKKLDGFEKELLMWVHEELIDGKNLTEIINTTHYNVKYLPGIKLPENVIAHPDLKYVTKDADILIVVLPHQFLNKALGEMKAHVKKGAYAVSLMKGLAMSTDKGICLLTDSVRSSLSIPCAVLMGANLAMEVAQEKFCEATIASKNPDIGNELKKLFQTNYFRIVIIEDEVTTELCGALKNIVAVAAGIVEGLGYGDNTKAAIIRLGFMEMKNFIYTFFGDRNPQEGTLLESCGVADLITTCYGGRNRKLGVALAKTTKPLSELEQELLNGQSAQGPLTASEVFTMLEPKGLLGKYPLFTAIHKLCNRQMDPKDLISCLTDHPEHR